MADFEGVYPALITPMDSNGELNEKAFRQLIEFNIQAGVHGFWVAGGTGESIFLTDEENMRIAEIAADQNSGRVKNIMHVGAPTTDRAVKLAKHAASVGVEAVCCVPPYFYAQPDQSIVDHYKAVGEAAGLPLFAYNLPQATQVEITPELMSKIKNEVPELKGLKHSSFIFQNVRNFLDMGLDCFTGSHALLLPALSLGAVGMIDGPPCALPEIYVEIWNSFKNGNLEKAKIAQQKALTHANKLLEYEYFPSIKAIVSERLGIDCGNPRKPFPQIDDSIRKNVAEIVADL